MENENPKKAPTAKKKWLIGGGVAALVLVVGGLAYTNQGGLFKGSVGDLSSLRMASSELADVNANTSFSFTTADRTNQVKELAADSYEVAADTEFTATLNYTGTGSASFDGYFIEENTFTASPSADFTRPAATVAAPADQYLKSVRSNTLAPTTMFKATSLRTAVLLASALDTEPGALLPLDKQVLPNKTSLKFKISKPGNYVFKGYVISPDGMAQLLNKKPNFKVIPNIKCANTTPKLAFDQSGTDYSNTPDSIKLNFSSTGEKVCDFKSDYKFELSGPGLDPLLSESISEDDFYYKVGAFKGLITPDVDVTFSVNLNSEVGKTLKAGEYTLHALKGLELDDTIKFNVGDQSSCDLTSVIKFDQSGTDYSNPDSIKLNFSNNGEKVCDNKTDLRFYLSGPGIDPTLTEQMSGDDFTKFGAFKGLLTSQLDPSGTKGQISVNLGSEVGKTLKAGEYTLHALKGLELDDTIKFNVGDQSSCNLSGVIKFVTPSVSYTLGSNDTKKPLTAKVSSTKVCDSNKDLTIELVGSGLKTETVNGDDFITFGALNGFLTIVPFDKSETVYSLILDFSKINLSEGVYTLKINKGEILDASVQVNVVKATKILLPPGGSLELSQATKDAIAAKAAAEKAAAEKLAAEQAAKDAAKLAADQSEKSAYELDKAKSEAEEAAAKAAAAKSAAEKAAAEAAAAKAAGTSSTGSNSGSTSGQTTKTETKCSDAATVIAISQGIITECRPVDSIKRYEEALILARFAQKNLNANVNSSGKSLSFVDESTFAKEQWRAELYEALRKFGILKGNGNGQLLPGSRITYIEHYKALQNLYITLGLAKPYQYSQMKEATAYLVRGDSDFTLNQDTEWQAQAIQFAIDKRLTTVSVRELFSPALRGNVVENMIELE